MKKSRFLGPVLTLALAFGMAFGTYAINKSAVNLVPNNHYEVSPSVCITCIADAIEPGFQCTLNNSGVPCTCDFSTRQATTDGISEPECLPLYKNAL